MTIEGMSDVGSLVVTVTVQSRSTASHAEMTGQKNEIKAHADRLAALATLSLHWHMPDLFPMPAPPSES